MGYRDVETSIRDIYYHQSHIRTFYDNHGGLQRADEISERLEQFTFTYVGLSNRIPCIDAVEICRALLPHRASLKRLEIRGYEDLWGPHQEPVGSVITSFPMLKDIGIPVAPLQMREISSAFPQTVVKLRLYMYDEWPLWECEVEVRRMLVNKWACLVFPFLQEIWFEYWDATESEKYSPDEEEWVSKRGGIIERMVQLGREAGVKVKFDVDETSRSDFFVISRALRAKA